MYQPEFCDITAQGRLKAVWCMLEAASGRHGNGALVNSVTPEEPDGYSCQKQSVSAKAISQLLSMGPCVAVYSVSVLMLEMLTNL
jgi:hypothetical protein